MAGESLRLNAVQYREIFRVDVATVRVLPVENVLPELKQVLRQNTAAVLEAPTGAGKTTRVPLALLGEPWLRGKRLIILEPRRLAARSAARHMASLLGEKAGETVGYRVRMDTKVSRKTKVEVVTEGVLTRMIQDDPMLHGVGGIVFDEFHERNLQADLGLALTLELREALRPELRVLVMSATLDAGPIAELLDCERVVSEGQSYPVEVEYADRRLNGWPQDYVPGWIQKAIDEEEGDVLVFLPGAGEIRRTKERLEESHLPDNVEIRPLFGNLSNHEQDAAIKPSDPGTRKIVLATPIAETSLTIDGIRVVVDSGLLREPRFDPQSGMTRLVTSKVSKASAEQRKGRAGRVEPGVCYRLWTRHSHQHLNEHNAPEISQADLTPLALELACWGVNHHDELAWLDPPPSSTYKQAVALLQRLDAIDEEGRVTPHGREMASLGLHPRLGHMAVRAEELDHGALACDLAALLSERDIFRGRGEAPDVDLRLRLQAFADIRGGRDVRSGYGHSFTVKQGAARHVLRVSNHWRKKLGISRGEQGEIEAAGLLVAFAYPDRVAQKREGTVGRFRLRSGQAAKLMSKQLMSDEEYIVAAHVDGRKPEGRIFLAAPILLTDIETHFSKFIRPEHEYRWDGEAGIVRVREQERLGAIILKDGPLRNPEPSRMAETLLQGIREEGMQVIPWSKKQQHLLNRLQFLHQHGGDPWPDFSDEALLDEAGDWLTPHLFGMKRLEDVRKLNLTEVLLSRLDWDQRQKVDRLAPTHWKVPSGQRRPIDYSNPEAPVLGARIQEFFGLTETPHIMKGRVPLTLHLLSPAHRPAQVTQDLANFWANTYFEVRKDLRGRYPKHYWPEDPLSAIPTHKVRPDRQK